ncbi:hypothetical protein Lesp02_17630 [Lentzea sp. NBRC 105346]|nr:hypothetical protein Lesp02_17630 [Lentzea sp. NBRC 105346]
MVGGPVDQQVVLSGEEPGQRAGCELVPAVAEQVRGRAVDDEVDLELDVPMPPHPDVAPVPHHQPVESGGQSQVFEHRKK